VAQWYGADDAGCFLLGEADAGTPGPERLRALLGETGREPVESLD
jgi:hypothetical protein